MYSRDRDTANAYRVQVTHVQLTSDGDKLLLGLLPVGAKATRVVLSGNSLMQMMMKRCSLKVVNMLVTAWLLTSYKR